MTTPDPALTPAPIAPGDAPAVARLPAGPAALLRAPHAPTILGLLAALCLTVIVFAGLRMLREDALRRARVDVENTSLLIEQLALQMVESIDASLTGIQGLWLHLPPDRRPSAEEMYRRLRERVGADPDLRALYVLDARGEVVHDSAALPAQRFNFSDREYFKVHVQGDRGLYVSDMMQGQLTGRWGLVMSRRLANADGSFAGAVVAALEPARFEQACATLAIGQEGLINLRHEGGRLIVRVPHLDGAVGQWIPSTPSLMQQIREHGVARGELVSRFDGVTRLYASRRVGDLPLMVWVGLSRDEVLAPFERGARWIGAAALGLGLALAAAVLLRRRGRGAPRD